MERVFEVFKGEGENWRAIKRGFSWPGFSLTFAWALSQRLWGHGTLLLFWWVLILLLAIPGNSPIPAAVLAVITCLVAGIRGNEWKIKAAEEDGFEFRYSVPAANAKGAVAKVLQSGDSVSADWLRRGTRRTMFDWVPEAVQGMAAVAWLTVKAAFRFRLVAVLLVILMGGVVLLPMLIKHDGTARGFTQIVLTYTLSMITALLGFATLWLACGTLARDIDESQMQMVAVKPVPRWKVWMGKLLGIMGLNIFLLVLSAGAVFGMMQWRAEQLPPEQQAVLRNEIFVARGSASPEIPDYEAEAEQVLMERLQQGDVPAEDLPLLRRQVLEALKSNYEIVPPNTRRPWVIDLGVSPEDIKDQPVFLRFKFNAADPDAKAETYEGRFVIGEFESPTAFRFVQPSLAPDTFHEMALPPHVVDEDGRVIVNFVNWNDTALLVPLVDGIEVLYREGNFGLNFARGVAIIFCWLTLLATIGLFSASFLSFPVAAFLSLGILFIGLSSGIVDQVIEQGTVLAVNPNTGMADEPALVDYVALPVFKGLRAVIHMVKGFSPIDALSRGRSVSWGEVSLAFLQIGFIMGGIFAVGGMIALSRRELATAQSTQ